jgi:hypothetical protein
MLDPSYKSNLLELAGSPLPFWCLFMVTKSIPIPDTREYRVQFPDGATETFAANAIAEDMHAQIDDEGREYVLVA